MRIALLSDLHLECEAWTPPALDADVVILAGDIGKHTFCGHNVTITPLVYGSHVFLDTGCGFQPQDYPAFKGKLGLTACILPEARFVRADYHSTPCRVSKA